MNYQIKTPKRAKYNEKKSFLCLALRSFINDELISIDPTKLTIEQAKKIQEELKPDNNSGERMIIVEVKIVG